MASGGKLQNERPKKVQRKINQEEAESFFETSLGKPNKSIDVVNSPCVTRLV